MGSQGVQSGITLRRPETKLARREALLAQPETLTIVGEDLHRRPPSVAEDEKRAAVWIASEFISSDLRKAVDAAAKIGRLDRDENACLGGKLNHRQEVQTCATMAASWSIDAFSSLIVIRRSSPVPTPEFISNRSVGEDESTVPVISTKHGRSVASGFR